MLDDDTCIPLTLMCNTLRIFFFFCRLLKRKNMESVNLDMDEIFEEEDEDFPTVGALPDLPQDDEGTGETGQGEDQDGNTFFYMD